MTDLPLHPLIHSPRAIIHSPLPQVLASDGQGVPVGRISRQEVAALCVASLESAKAGHATFSVVSTTAKKKKTKEPASTAVAVAPISSSSSSSDDALEPYKQLLRRIGRPDSTPLQRKPHRLAVALFVLGFSVVAAGVTALLGQLAGLLLTALRYASLSCASCLFCSQRPCCDSVFSDHQPHRTAPASAAATSPLWRRQQPKPSFLWWK